MKILKKSISFVLALVFIISTTAFAEVKEEKTKDIINIEERIKKKDIAMHT